MAHLYIFLGAELAAMHEITCSNTIQNLIVVRRHVLRRVLNTIHKYLIVCSLCVLYVYTLVLK